ncbi:Zinc transporter 5 [Ceratocystis lukuohia]|uniref:Zinc transporter 5 n=1 Tax=Ceratocystis lukuohia TaxID=2019550 RepID=A0ABR4MN45_9PEZI
MLETRFKDVPLPLFSIGEAGVSRPSLRERTTSFFHKRSRIIMIVALTTFLIELSKAAGLVAILLSGSLYSKITSAIITSSPSLSSMDSLSKRHIGHDHGHNHEHEHGQGQDHGHEHHHHHHVEAYNVGLHVIALFVIFISSSAACAFPAFMKSLRGAFRFQKVIYAGYHMGTGVLMATAFVHLLPTAFAALTHESLPRFFTEIYPSIPGAISLATILLVIFIEMLLSPHRRQKSTEEPPRILEGREQPPELSLENSIAVIPLDPMQVDPNKTLSPSTYAMPPHARQQSLSLDDESRRHAEMSEVKTPQALEFERLKLQHAYGMKRCRLLEAGIIFHSVFIGITLGVSNGPGFIPFLIAIMFHQAFEGVALGSRIINCGWDFHKAEACWMIIIYGLTTPIGIAIGIAIHALYEPESPTGLIVVGIANAISGGLLAFASLCEIIPDDFLSARSWETHGAVSHYASFFLMVFGAFLMSLVAYWA